MYVPSTLQKLRKETFAGCRNLRKVEVAEGCEIAVERDLPSTVEVVTIPTRGVLKRAESGSDSGQNTMENMMILQTTGERNCAEITGTAANYRTVEGRARAAV